MPESLTAREREICNLLLEGNSPKEIANTLHISYHTVDYHRSNLYRKLGIQSIQELFAKYYDNGNGNTTAETKPAASVLGTKKRKFFLIAGIAIFTVSLFCIGYYFLKPATEDLPPKGVIIPLVDLGLRPYSDKRYNGGNSTADVYISRETIDGETINVINVKTNLIESEVNVWGKDYRHYDFEKETIWLFIISANMDIQDYGPALLQIWDFEVY
ncbi:MAG: helix-turn-helix transcriptional regulator [Treponema sp.]|nr:helix-turn-helix transcriptional regulator [Treponema sp.]